MILVLGGIVLVALITVGCSFIPSKNQDTSKTLENIAREKNIPIVGKIPFDRRFSTSMVQGKTIIEFNPNGQLRLTLEQIWNRICQHL